MSQPTPREPSNGVVTLPGDSPLVHPSLRQSVDTFLASAEPGVLAGMLELKTATGANLALVGVNASGTLGVKLWVGKSGWDTPLRESVEAGVQVAWKVKF